MYTHEQIFPFFSLYVGKRQFKETRFKGKQTNKNDYQNLLGGNKLTINYQFYFFLAYIENIKSKIKIPRINSPQNMGEIITKLN